MLNTPPNKKVYPNEIKPGDVFKGYEYHNGDSHTTHLCEVIVNNEGVPLVWGRNPITDPYDYFTRKMTWQEEAEWYKSQIDFSKSDYLLNLIGLHTDLYSVGDAYHEMWNGWIQVSWEEQLVSLENETFFILGVSPAPYGYSGCRDPVAVICEYKSDGERFWCHAEKDWIEDMRDESREIYKNLIKEEDK